VVDFNVSFVNAGFEVPDTICMPAIVNFMDQSTNVTTYNWSFGDSQTSSTASPTHTYPGPGTYLITLITANPNSCNKLDTAIKTIHVFDSPVADFDWTPYPPVPNTPNVFTNLSVGGNKYDWNFGDGTTSNEKNPTHVYEKDGTYQVCLTTSNDVGCKDTQCKSVRSIVYPIVDVPTGFSPNGDGINDVVFVRGYGIETLTFRIFNRWGEKIFETTDKNRGWDGTYKSVLQEMEVYQYTLTVTFFDGTQAFKKGNITLLK
jgi:gliding motility-associated-like protein